MRLADHSVSLKALPVNALIGLEQTTRFTGGHDGASWSPMPGISDQVVLS